VKIYIASSWKNQHAVEMLTALLRARGHDVKSFVENNNEDPDCLTAWQKKTPFDEWCASASGKRSFEYDTTWATESDLVIYIGPSGCDAWAEVGAAWAAGVPILALAAKGEQVGLMRRMVLEWLPDFRLLLACVDECADAVDTGRTWKGVKPRGRAAKAASEAPRG
jgi:hypothetical protein